MKKISGNTFKLIMMIPHCLIGLLLFGLLFKFLFIYVQVKSWIPTQATIVKFEKIEYFEKGKSRQHAEVIFEYYFNGKRYQSNGFGFSYLKKSFKFKYNNDYDLQLENVKRIEVYINPQKPSQAIMNKRHSFHFWFFLFFAFFWNGILSLGLIVMFSNKRVYTNNFLNNE